MIREIRLAILIFGAILLAVFSADGVRKYRKKPSVLLKYILLLFIPAFFSFAFLVIDGFAWQVLYEVSLGFSLSLLCNILTNAGLIWFTTEVYIVTDERSIRKSNLLRIAFIMINSVLTMWVFLVVIFAGTVDQAFLPISLIMLCIMGFLIILAIGSFRLAKRVNSPEHQKSLRYIGIFSIGYLSIYILLLVEFMAGDLWEFIDIFVEIYILFVFYVGYRGFLKPIDPNKNGEDRPS